MLNELKNFKDKSTLIFVPPHDLKYCDSIEYTLGNVIKIDKFFEDEEITDFINLSKINKIYLFGYHDLYRFILPRLKKSINICWVFNDSFSNLSSSGVRYVLNTIFEYYDRELIDKIGCLSIDNKNVFVNAGYKSEYIDLKIKKVLEKHNNSKTIGILSDDFDPNNNFYNQLAALTMVDYDECKFKSVMAATNHFCKYFNIKSKIIDNIDEVMKDNFVNLYVNFTNTNKELIMRSYNFGVPVIVGNTDFYCHNKYLQEHLVVRSDDDINEIADKIRFVLKNYKKIMDEYKKMGD